MNYFKTNTRFLPGEILQAFHYYQYFHRIYSDELYYLVQPTVILTVKIRTQSRSTLSPSVFH